MRIDTKICTKCTERKPLTDFNEYEPGKKRNVCKICQRAKCVDWEEENKKRHEAGLTNYPLNKICYKCKIEKVRDDYTKDWTRTDGLYSLCKECCAKKSSQIYKDHQEEENARRYEWLLEKKYGISLYQKEQIFEKQGQVCAICKSSSVGKQVKGKDVVWPIDHDHSTGKVRGVLCVTCNLTLGLVKDSVEQLKNLISYLEKYNN